MIVGSEPTPSPPRLTRRTLLAGVVAVPFALTTGTASAEPAQRPAAVASERVFPAATLYPEG